MDNEIYLNATDITKISNLPGHEALRVINNSRFTRYRVGNMDVIPLSEYKFYAAEMGYAIDLDQLLQVW